VSPAVTALQIRFGKHVNEMLYTKEEKEFGTSLLMGGLYLEMRK
jgi:hypothetical protein